MRSRRYGCRARPRCLLTPSARLGLHYSHIVVADTVGNVHMVDLRSLRSVGTFRGFAGAVRSVQFHKSEPFVAAVGLDRYLRIYNTTTRSLHKQVRAVPLMAVSESGLPICLLCMVGVVGSNVLCTRY